jgi:hypothetical protein
MLFFPFEVCRNFFFEFLDRSDSAVQAGPGEQADLDLGHVEPASIAGTSPEWR